MAIVVARTINPNISFFPQMIPGATVSTGDHSTDYIGYLSELRVYTRPHNPVVITQNTFISVTENSPDVQHAWNFTVTEGDYFIDCKVRFKGIFEQYSHKYVHTL